MAKASFLILEALFHRVVVAVLGLCCVGLGRSATPNAAAAGAPAANVVGATVPAEPYSPPKDPAELLRVNQAMRDYFAPLVTAPAGSNDRLQQIVDAVLKPTGLNFEYDVEGTYDAAETFRRRRGNCVSYSLLMVAVAREFGFAATFQNVEAGTRWTRFGTVIASVMHLDVRVQTDDGLFLVDLRPDLLPSTRIEAMQVITDERAFSEFYDTLGLFRLVHHAPEEARWCMKRATELDPRLAAHWRNLANVQVRIGDLQSARTCFERALRVDRYDLSAAASLVELLRLSGTPDDLKRAAKLERRAQAMRDRNPYWQEHLGRLAEEQHDWAEAEKRYRRAIALNDEEVEFYAPWIAALRQLGHEEDAQRAELQLTKIRARVARHSIHFSS